MKKILVVLLLCAGLGPGASGQEQDSVVKKQVVLPTVVRWIGEDSFLHDTLTSFLIDSTLHRIHLVNGAENSFHAYLANNGSAGDPTLFSLSSQPYTLARLPGYEWLFRKSSDTRYYKTNKRFSEITYFSGAQKDQTVRVIHSQNIVRNWSVGFDFLRGGADGYLLNSETFKTSFNAFTWYHTRNKRYQALAQASWETVKNQVNGGVTNDSLYDNLDLNSRDLQGLSVHLSGAENHVRSRVFSLHQFLDLGPKEAFDTGQTVFRHRPRYRLSLDNSVQKYAFAYTDGINDSLYYAHTYYGDTGNDSLAAIDFRNGISLSHFPSATGSLPSRLYYSAGVTWQWLEYHQRSIDTAYDNASLKFSLRTAENDSVFQAGAEGEYVFSGDNSSCYRATATASLPVYRSWTVAAAVEGGKYNPSVFFHRYYSNHFIRERQPEPVTYTRLHFRISSRPHKLESGLYFWSVEQYPFFDASALPEQYAPAVDVLQAYLKKDFAWRNFRFDNTVCYQHAGNDSILHLPEFSTYHALYYAVPAFKKAVYFATGIDARIQSHFDGNDFMPSTGFFYLQDTIRTGGQVLVSLFFNFKIKTADLFVKYENVGSLFFDNKYYLVPHQPMQGASFKIGIRWRFYDQ